MADNIATTGAETSTDVDNTTSVLTGAADEGSTETNSETDVNNTSDNDTGAADNTSEGEGDAGAEGNESSLETYADFEMPEGMQIDETLLAEAVPIFKELELNQEQAQKLVDFQAKQVQAGKQTQVDDFNQLVNDWREQSKNDGEFGGDKFDENVKVAQSAISAYGTPELKQLLEEHGIGNNPELIRFMVRVGQGLKEDVPGASGSEVSTAADRVSILYPNDK